LNIILAEIVFEKGAQPASPRPLPASSADDRHGPKAFGSSDRTTRCPYAGFSQQRWALDKCIVCRLLSWIADVGLHPGRA